MFTRRKERESASSSSAPVVAPVVAPVAAIGLHPRRPTLTRTGAPSSMRGRSASGPAPRARATATTAGAQTTARSARAKAPAAGPSAGGSGSKLPRSASGTAVSAKAKFATPGGPTKASSARLKRPASEEKISTKADIVKLLHQLRDGYGPTFDDAHKALTAARKSFSDVEYEDVAAFFELPIDIKDTFQGWAEMELPQVLLPAAVVDEVTLRVVQSHVSPGPAADLQNEAATAAFLAGPFQTIVCQFGGVLTDKPEKYLPKMDLSGGGHVEGKVFCRSEILLFVRELKYDLGVKFAKAVAQVMCELFAAWEFNKRFNQDIPDDFLVPVRACLCDVKSSHFVSFDGQKFSKSSTAAPALSTLENTIEAALEMARVTFGLLLDGYAKAVDLYGSRSIARGISGDLRAGGSHLKVVSAPVRLEALDMTAVDRPSTRGWRIAADGAYRSVAYFSRAWELESEIVAEKAMTCLHDSISNWPVAGKQLLLPSGVQRIAAQAAATYRAALKNANHEPDWEPPARNLLPYELRVFRQSAVAEFWRSCHVLSQDLVGALEAQMRSPVTDIFTQLATYAAHLATDAAVKQEMWTMGVQAGLSASMTRMLIGKLETSHQEEYWVVKVTEEEEEDIDFRMDLDDGHKPWRVDKN
ncbi:hypothetical protein DFH06DRAFT_1374077 [Mycena polygramma]|nr:hypothetical protein DFH06DRAFT_1374077 [Mycena polygramma]